jgi:protein-arginine kinase activator protein McsA
MMLHCERVSDICYEQHRGGLQGLFGLASNTNSITSDGACICACAWCPDDQDPDWSLVHAWAFDASHILASNLDNMQPIWSTKTETESENVSEQCCGRLSHVRELDCASRRY